MIASKKKILSFFTVLFVSSFSAAAFGATRLYTGGLKCFGKNYKTDINKDLIIEFGELREITGDYGHALRHGPHVTLSGSLIADLKTANAYPEKPKEETLGLGVNTYKTTHINANQKSFKVQLNKDTVIEYTINIDNQDVSLKALNAKTKANLFKETFKNCSSN